MDTLNFSRTVSSKLQNKINKSIIFNYLRENSSISRAKISKNLKISAPAVSRVIEKLITEGYVVETEKIKTKSGKRPTLLKINKDKGYVIGIDLGKEKIRVALTNLNIEIIEKHQGFRILDNGDIAIKIKSEIKKFLNKYNQKKNKTKKTKSYMHWSSSCC